MRKIEISNIPKLTTKRPPPLHLEERQRSESHLPYGPQTASALYSPLTIHSPRNGIGNVHPDHNDTKVAESTAFLDNTISSLEGALQKVKNMKTNLEHKQAMASTAGATPSNVFRAAESASVNCQACINRLVDDFNDCKQKSTSSNRIMKRSSTAMFRQRRKALKTITIIPHPKQLPYQTLLFLLYHLPLPQVDLETKGISVDYERK
eukprot:TRINITY_DN2486_c0_g1_i1.p1 TRINITY_DN2486_c0_g1~~TRINITY_DN2486_c0_g1_i1.p1  ORF type:complete len:207 (+),score=16.82 TRINITY_DN2486_c0_g1_i1:277-897(+)